MAPGAEAATSPSLSPACLHASPAALHSPGLAGGCRDLPRGVDHPAEHAGALGDRHAAVVFGDVVQNHTCRRGASWGCWQGDPSRPPAGQPLPHPVLRWGLGVAGAGGRGLGAAGAGGLGAGGWGWRGLGAWGAGPGGGDWEAGLGGVPQESLRLQPRLPRRLPPPRARCGSSLGSGPCPAPTPPLPTTLLPVDGHMRPWPGAAVSTVQAEPSPGQVPAEGPGVPSMGVGGADALSLGSFPRVLGEQLSSPSGQKQPKVQKLEQLCCGLEQVLTQVSPHSRYTWLAGHWPTAAGPCGPRERGQAPRAWPPTPPWPRT